MIKCYRTDGEKQYLTQTIHSLKENKLSPQFKKLIFILAINPLRPSGNYMNHLL
jgi:hypothetical protein